MTFSNSRFKTLLRNEFTVRRSTAQTTFAGIAIAMIIVHLIGMSNDGTPVDIAGWAIPITFIWGVVEASRAFADMHDKHQVHSFLLLPASAAEKTLSRYAVITIGLLGAIAMFLAIMSALCALISMLFFQQIAFIPFIPENPLNLFFGFVLLQSLHFLGAAWFKSSHFSKTFLSTAGFLLVLLMALAVFVLMLFPETRVDGMELNFDFDAMTENEMGTMAFLAALVTTAVFALVPASCVYIAKQRVQEAQVSDGK